MYSSFRLTIRNVNFNTGDIIGAFAVGFRLTIRNVNTITYEVLYNIALKKF